MHRINKALVERFGNNKSRTMKAYVEWIRENDMCFQQHGNYIIEHLPDKEFTTVIRFLDEWSIEVVERQLWGSVIMRMGLCITNEYLLTADVIKARGG